MDKAEMTKRIPDISTKDARERAAIMLTQLFNHLQLSGAEKFALLGLSEKVKNALVLLQGRGARTPS